MRGWIKRLHDSAMQRDFRCEIREVQVAWIL
jgi:hypothetical protein